MTMRSIVDKIYAEMACLEVRLKSIQDECSHPKEALDKQHCGSTGNYDTTQDCYWTNFHCTLCDKRWRVEGSK